jgi:hypothetical protein
LNIFMSTLRQTKHACSLFTAFSTSAVIIHRLWFQI